MNINYLVFSSNSKFMGACSDVGIIHGSNGSCWKSSRKRNLIMF